MRIVPRAATSAGPEPEIPAKNTLTMTVTMPSPPRRLPTNGPGEVDEPPRDAGPGQHLSGHDEEGDREEVPGVAGREEELGHELQGREAEAPDGGQGGEAEGQVHGEPGREEEAQPREEGHRDGSVHGSSSSASTGVVGSADRARRATVTIAAMAMPHRPTGSASSTHHAG